MKINVTQEHIDKGERNTATCCPVALAMQDAGLDGPLAGGQSLYWGSGPTLHIARHPDSVHSFIYAFDAGFPVGPFEFDLDVTA